MLCIPTVVISIHAKAAMVTQAMALVFSQEMAVHMFFNHNVFIMQGLLTSIQVCIKLIYWDGMNSRAADKLPVSTARKCLMLIVMV